MSDVLPPAPPAPSWAHAQPHAQMYSVPQQPYGGYAAVMMSSKSRVAYILLGLFLGGLGIHNFYVGRVGPAVAQLLLIVFLGWTGVVALAVMIWIIIEVCTVTTDSQGRRLRA
ncbi:NINE protein [Demequina globuliformis]|uniref:NINE protein n=1 Tax=Demequina globuliformis TaxID=676202 RepID=UPI00137933A5|nr:NINE protein [Demequina globuliformis]